MRDNCKGGPIWTLLQTAGGIQKTRTLGSGGRAAPHRRQHASSRAAVRARGVAWRSPNDTPFTPGWRLPGARVGSGRERCRVRGGPHGARHATRCLPRAPRWWRWPRARKPCGAATIDALIRATAPSIEQRARHLRPGGRNLGVMASSAIRPARSASSQDRRRWRRRARPPAGGPGATSARPAGADQGGVAGGVDAHRPQCADHPAGDPRQQSRRRFHRAGFVAPAASGQLETVGRLIVALAWSGIGIGLTLPGTRHPRGTQTMTSDQIVVWLVWPAIVAAVVGFGALWISRRIP
jgi:hypothetical protein